MSRLEVVAEREVPDEEVPQAAARANAELEAIEKRRDAATAMLITGIKALSQKFVTAVAHFFTLMTVATAFYLWLVAMPSIDTPKIISLSIYSVFILALNIWGRK